MAPRTSMQPTQPRPSPKQIGQFFTEGSNQIIAVLPTFFVLTSCAFQYSWTITRPSLILEKHFVMSWFIGAMIGAFKSSVLVYRVPKRVIYCTSAALSLISSGIFIGVENHNADIAVRYLSGIAFGWCAIPGIVHAAEIADKRFRGSLCSIVSIPQIVALLIGSILVISTDNQRPSYGILSIIFALLGVVSSLKMTESPTFLLMKGHENAAEESLRTLCKVTFRSPKVAQELEETQTLIEESRQLKVLPFAEGNLKAVIVVGSLRVVNALSMSYPLILQLAFFYVLIGTGKNSLMIIVACRAVFEVLNVIVIDCCGHFEYLRCTLAPSGLALFIFALILETAKITSSMQYLVILINTYQILVGWSLNTSSVTYLAQSFPIVKKPASIFIIFTAEMLIHILSVAFFDAARSYTTICFIVGAVTFLLGVVICCLLPNTTGKTLKEAQELMRKH